MEIVDSIRTAIVVGADGIARAKSQHDWDMLPDAEKAALLVQDTKRWASGGSGASRASMPIEAAVAPVPPKRFDDQDRSIRDNWQPSAEELRDFDKWNCS